MAIAPGAMVAAGCGPPSPRIADRLPQGMDEAAWLTIRPNLERLGDVREWWRVVTGPVAAPALSAEDAAFAGDAADAAAAIQWDQGAWKALTERLKQSSGRKGKALFLPLRLALTGMDHGPDMSALLPLIGKERAVERLRQAA